MKYQLSWQKGEDIALLEQLVAQNEVFLGSTDTVLGLMGAVTLEVQEKIDNMKQRKEKPYLVLVDSLDQIQEMVYVDKRMQDFLLQIWPAPITVLLPKKASTPTFIGSQTAVGFRMPNHKGLRVLAASSPYGLFSTSANISGEPIPLDLQHVPLAIKDACSCYVDDQEAVGSVASTIVDMTQGEPKLIREGVVPFDDILLAWQKSTR